MLCSCYVNDVLIGSEQVRLAAPVKLDLCCDDKLLKPRSGPACSRPAKEFELRFDMTFKKMGNPHVFF
jgi:hypothetical protein